MNSKALSDHDIGKGNTSSLQIAINLYKFPTRCCFVYGFKFLIKISAYFNKNKIK